jgi:L-rhamnose mutarotase
MKSILLFALLFSLIAGCSPEQTRVDVVRKGSVIKVKPEMLEQYRTLHANPWPAVDRKLKECNIQNYSIYFRDGYLFSYLEYTGENWDEDMAILAADSVTQAWWKLTDPCQEPIESATESEWWAELEEVYHLD